MKSFVGRLIVLRAVLALPATVFAQEAVLTDAITDSTGAVLPGATVTAVNEATGNNYETVTDAAGVYRIPVRVGVFKVTANLAGFGEVMRAGVQLLVGQTITSTCRWRHPPAPPFIVKFTITSVRHAIPLMFIAFRPLESIRSS